MSKKIRIIIADNHPLIRKSLVNILNKEPDIEILCTVNNGNEAVHQALELVPDVVIMGISMPLCSGPRATSLIKKKYPSIRVILLGFLIRGHELQQARQAGVNRCLLYNATVNEILDAVYNRKITSSSYVRRYFHQHGHNN